VGKGESLYVGGEMRVGGRGGNSVFGGCGFGEVRDACVDGGR